MIPAYAAGTGYSLIRLILRDAYSNFVEVSGVNWVLRAARPEEGHRGLMADFTAPYRTGCFVGTVPVDEKMSREYLSGSWFGGDVVKMAMKRSWPDLIGS